MEAGAGAVVTSKGTGTNTTTSLVQGTAFTGTNLDTCDGVLLHCQRLTSTGTVTVQISNGVLTGTVTVNASDLPVNPAWVFFKFTALTVVFDGTATWKVGVLATSAGNAKFYGPGASDFAHLCRLTSTGTPAASDNFYIVSELTGPTLNNALTVTMNGTATTAWGQIDGCYLGTLTYGVAASTNYYLKCLDFFEWDSFTLNMGTSGTRMPSTSTAVLEFNSASAAQYGLQPQANSTLNMYGAVRSFVQTKLTADAAAAATTLTTADSTGWLNTDVLCLPSTTATPSQSESKAMTGNVTGTSIPITALTNAHSGTSPTQGEVGLVTRNVIIRGVSAANSGYIAIGDATVHCEYAEFANLGTNTNTKRGINTDNTTKAVSFTYCSFHDFTNTSAYAFSIGRTTAPLSSTSLTISNNVFWNIAQTGIEFNNGGLAGVTVQNNLFVGCSDNVRGVICFVSGSDFLLTMSGNTIAGCSANGIFINGSGISAIGDWSGNTIHSCGGTAVILSQSTTAGVISGTWSTLTAWRSQVGINVGNNRYSGLVFDSANLFGNTSTNIQIANSADRAVVGNEQLFTNCTVDAGVTVTAPIGVQFLGGAAGVAFETCTFGASHGHSTGDIQINTTGNIVIANFRNCLLNSTTVISGQTKLGTGSAVGFQKYQQTAGNHRTVKGEGTITIDTVIYDVSPSARLTPNSATLKLQSGQISAPVANGGTLTPSIKVRKSVASDGTAYNGNAPRLMVRKNVAAGISADTVLATDGGSGSSSTTWGSGGTAELLTGTTVAVTDDAVLDFFVDCDGTQGWINVDTFMAV